MIVPTTKIDFSASLDGRRPQQFIPNVPGGGTSRRTLINALEAFSEGNNLRGMKAFL
jgi:hypothetical protein